MLPGIIRRLTLDLRAFWGERGIDKLFLDLSKFIRPMGIHTEFMERSNGGLPPV